MMNKAKFMSSIVLSAMQEQDDRHPNRRGERNQQELNEIIQEMLSHYPSDFLTRIGVADA